MARIDLDKFTTIEQNLDFESIEKKTDAAAMMSIFWEDNVLVPLERALRYIPSNLPDNEIKLTQHFTWEIHEDDRVLNSIKYMVNHAKEDAKKQYEYWQRKHEKLSDALYS